MAEPTCPHAMWLLADDGVTCVMRCANPACGAQYAARLTPVG